MKYFEPKNLLLILIFVITNILYSSCQDEYTENINLSEALELLDSDPQKTLDILSSVAETDLNEE